MAMLEEENPFQHEKLSPSHLALLYPAVFYQNDEALAQHLSESCLVENTTWEGENAIGETAFWLKVLSTPQTTFLKEQKRLFKTAIADKCKTFTLNVNKVNVLAAGDTVATKVVARKPKVASPMVFKATKDSQEVVIPCLQTEPDANKPKTVVAVQESLPVVMIPDTADAAVVSAAATAGPPMLLEIDQIDQDTIDSIASPTPGFGIKAFKCRNCEFSTDTRERLKHHQKYTHAPERPYSCPRCDYTSAFPWNIKTHLESVHLKTNKFKCDQCSFASSQACLLRRHINRVHLNSKNLKCAYCNYKASHKDVLKRHVNMKHTKQFAHKCPHCDFGRDAKYEVEDHINAVHLKKVLYQCSDCDFQTYRKITLRSHHKDHESKTLLTCEICEIRSIYPSVMIKHFKTDHPTTEIPDQLKHMRKKPQDSTLLSNDRDYTPVMVCRCKYCPFISESVSKLKSHVRRVHPDTVDQSLFCQVCQVCFASKASLATHKRKKHPELKAIKPNQTEPKEQTKVADAPVEPEVAETPVEQEVVDMPTTSITELPRIPARPSSNVVISLLVRNADDMETTSTALSTAVVE